VVPRVTNAGMGDGACDGVEKMIVCVVVWRVRVCERMMDPHPGPAVYFIYTCNLF
jgi:hypothetical protein